MPSDQLLLTVLGSATPYATVDNPCSGYLVTSGDTRVWIDAGSGTLAELQRHTRVDELDAIWISHLHADHSADLLTAYYALLFADIDLAAPIPLYGPPGTADRLAHFLTNGPGRSPVEAAFAVHELYDGHRAEVGALTITSRAVRHDMPAFAARVEGSGTSLTYSGDTAPCTALTDLAVDTDVLLCEAESDRAPADGQVHHTPENAADTARAAGARRLIVTHVGRFLTPADATSRAGALLGRDVEYAAPGETFTL
ncbi:MBL fold metallo-hydrolase [Prauserella halophila]|uniref:MBL fold metallo-hydrolase n=1 Tax=Prauserella halophila TaxID=185641 RepID=A0ABN1WLB5_9PSEU|nr:MBL fold metallo-hydrolase [Prauserella halophila]MCP2237921.1 Ribonuclease BN, tRNA processing enzyme [Prauserella halophila]